MTSDRPLSPRSQNRRRGGLAWVDLTVFGSGSTTDFQKTLVSYPRTLFNRLVGRKNQSKIFILHHLEGLLAPGERLLVLGKPGSGCSTFLKTLAGQTGGLSVEKSSTVNYGGISPHVMHKNFQGQCTYQAEIDVHFPHLTASQTLVFAIKARTRLRDPGIQEQDLEVKNKLESFSQALGLEQALEVKIGNELVPGISGGERKRTSIAEILVGGSTLHCWDNSTRGLDSANAEAFVQTLRRTTDSDCSMAVATLYQASQQIFDSFDKVLLLYEGQQVYFGSSARAKPYFTRLGFICPERMSTSDFLTSLTNESERIVQEGYEARVPWSPQEFANVWKSSPERTEIRQTIDDYCTKFPLIDGFQEKSSSTAKIRSFFCHSRKAPYKLTYPRQIQLCLNRCFQRLRNDLVPPFSAIIGNTVLSIILGSVFYNMPNDTSSFYGRGVLLFFVTLTNTFLGAFEGVQLWDQRPIVQKHFKYAFYRPSAEAVASMLCDVPNKLFLTTGFNVPLYFLANLRRTPGAFFTFYCFAFISLLVGSMLFRTIGSLSTTLTSSIAPGATSILLLIVYSGFVLPIPSMHPWLGWFRFINPIGYAFESFMINEFSARRFICSTLIPEGPDYPSSSHEGKNCTVLGSISGSLYVDGNDYLRLTYQYHRDHLWRNLVLILVIMVVLCFSYLFATEYNSSSEPRGEILLFRRNKDIKGAYGRDAEAQCRPVTTDDLKIGKRPKHAARTENGRCLYEEKVRAATFLWRSLDYEIRTKSGSKKLLDGVDGWIKPGTLTALMGASGAGKTTLLNVLAGRALTGMIGGETIVDPRFQTSSFARKVGYCQQIDLHLPTVTVREALIFSARMRQSARYSEEEKLAYVDEVIEILDMRPFADAVIGTPGEGLNVEQRKRVTIGVELATRPELLLFLDEPTSGLDSNTAWSICSLLRKLADSGQAILCTIHQPSAALFGIFDRVLLLQGGKPIYFGDIGHDSNLLTSYFEKNGARKCGPDENAAAWLLEVTAQSRIQWYNAWCQSEEYRHVQADLAAMKRHLLSQLRDPGTTPDEHASSEFAASFSSQLLHVTKRNILHDWRTPCYLYSKFLLTLGAGLVNGLSFYRSPNTLQGLQNQLFSIFLLFLLHSNLIQILLPHFLANRNLYEARERLAKTYSWKTFILANTISEIPWQTLLAVVQYLTWYYPVGMYRNAAATNQLNERSGLAFVAIWSFLLFSSTFSHMLGTIVPDAATGINISATLWSLSLIFCGILVKPPDLPKFWIFMYRVSPVTYLVSSLAATGVAGVDVACAPDEIITIDPPDAQKCVEYLQNYTLASGAHLMNPIGTEKCQLCPVASTDQALLSVGIIFRDRWRNLGISLAYVAANICGAMFFYWCLRVSRGARRQMR